MQGESAIVKGCGGMLGDSEGEEAEVKEGNDSVLLGCGLVMMVVEEASNKERHDICIDKGGAHLRIFLR